MALFCFYVWKLYICFVHSQVLWPNGAEVWTDRHGHLTKVGFVTRFVLTSWKMFFCARFSFDKQNVHRRYPRVHGSSMSLKQVKSRTT